VAKVTPLHNAALAAIPDGLAKEGGIATGNAAADAMIAARTGDRRFGPFRFTVGMLPGQWRPVPPPSSTLRGPGFVAVPGPQRPLIPSRARRYAKEFNEVSRSSDQQHHAHARPGERGQLLGDVQRDRDVEQFLPHDRGGAGRVAG
jgi:hypothetical protein